MDTIEDNTGSHTHDALTASPWWDHEQARWVQPTPTTAAPRAADDLGGPDRAPVDVRDMFVVHTAILREFRLAPDAVARVVPGARRRAATVDRHLGLICEILHHHHAGEDELLWPPLRARLGASAQTLLDEAEAQHAGLDHALQQVKAARRRWVERLDAGSRDGLVDGLRELHRLLAEHLDDEERTLLPLAAAHLSEPEWRAVGAAGAAAIPRSALPLVFGMFFYEGDRDVLAAMLEEAPALPRLVLPLVAPRVYARRATQLYGTSRP